jgi:hypothetical protein
MLTQEGARRRVDHAQAFPIIHCSFYASRWLLCINPFDKVLHSLLVAEAQNSYDCL